MKYRSKPVEVEAVQFISDDYGNLCAIGELGVKPIIKSNPLRLEINTDEGNLIAMPGNYIVKDSIGRLVIYHHSIFEKIYERI